MDWPRLLAYITGRVDQELLLRNEYLAAENHILKAQIKGRLLITYYVLFFIQLETRRVCLAGITPYPDQQWMEQQARNMTMKDWGFLAHSRVEHYHCDRNHQGKANRILFPSQTGARKNRGAVRCRERLGGLLKYYEREAA